MVVYIGLYRFIYVYGGLYRFIYVDIGLYMFTPHLPPPNWPRNLGCFRRLEDASGRSEASPTMTPSNPGSDRP